MHVIFCRAWTFQKFRSLYWFFLMTEFKILAPFGSQKCVKIFRGENSDNTYVSVSYLGYNCVFLTKSLISVLKVVSWGREACLQCNIFDLFSLFILKCNLFFCSSFRFSTYSISSRIFNKSDEYRLRHQCRCSIWCLNKAIRRTLGASWQWQSLQFRMESTKSCCRFHNY